MKHVSFVMVVHVVIKISYCSNIKTGGTKETQAGYTMAVMQ